MQNAPSEAKRMPVGQRKLVNKKAPSYANVAAAVVVAVAAGGT